MPDLFTLYDAAIKFIEQSVSSGTVQEGASDMFASAVLTDKGSIFTALNKTKTDNPFSEVTCSEFEVATIASSKGETKLEAIVTVAFADKSIKMPCENCCRKIMELNPQNSECEVMNSDNTSVKLTDYMAQNGFSAQPANPFGDDFFSGFDTPAPPPVKTIQPENQPDMVNGQPSAPPPEVMNGQPMMAPNDVMNGQPMVAPNDPNNSQPMYQNNMMNGQPMYQNDMMNGQPMYQNGMNNGQPMYQNDMMSGQPMYQNGMPMNGQPMYQNGMPMNGQPMYQNGMPMNGQPMYQNGMPMNGQPMYQNGMPMNGQPMYQNGMPMYGQPMYQNGMPMNGQPMYQNGMPMNGQPMYQNGMPMNGQPVNQNPYQNAAPVPPTAYSNGMSGYMNNQSMYVTPAQNSVTVESVSIQVTDAAESSGEDSGDSNVYQQKLKDFLNISGTPLRPLGDETPAEPEPAAAPEPANNAKDMKQMKKELAKAKKAAKKGFFS